MNPSSDLSYLAYRLLYCRFSTNVIVIADEEALSLCREKGVI